MEKLFEILGGMGDPLFKTSHFTNSRDKIFIGVPGFSRSDLEVFLERNMLIIKGEKEIDGEKFKLDKSIWINTHDPEILDLSLENGLLVVKIKESVKKKKMIQIN